MSKNKSKKVIIQIIPDGPGAIRDYTIPRWLLHFVLWVGFFLMITLGVVIFNISLVVEKMIMNENLKSANKRLYEENEHLRSIRKDLDSILILESKIKNITQVMLNGEPQKEIKIYEESQPVILTKNEIDSFVTDVQEVAAAKDPSNDPIEKPSVKPVIGIISQKYSATHQGTDIAALLNDPVFSTAPGIVIFSGWKKNLGITIEIDHNKGYTTLYGHLNRAVVNKGDFVKRGQNIGMIGMTGNTTGPHLHYEVLKDGLKVNPEDYFIN